MPTRSTKSENHPEETSRYPCLCAAIRKTGRVITRQYDEHLKPSGLKITQFSMLANIARNPAITVSDLAKLLFMDQTTVSRNLRVLERAGYIQLAPEVTDHRIKRIRIADAGLLKINEARPLWEKAQSEMGQRLGRMEIEGLLGSLKKMAG